MLRVPPFQLATPPGFQVNHIPNGILECDTWCKASTIDMNQKDRSSSGRKASNLELY